MHELIDREDPKCLYCHSSCDFRHDGIGFNKGQSSFEVQILTCTNCKEIFQIHWLEDEKSETTYYSFLFSCNGIVVVNDYERGMSVGGPELLWDNWRLSNPIPSEKFVSHFRIDFSNKEKLYNKLKTYQVFS